MSKNWQQVWAYSIEEHSISETSNALYEFIYKRIIPVACAQKQEAVHNDVIKIQTYGEGIQPDQLDKIARYETHLDRKFEKTLAMLLKLKEVRTRPEKDI